MRLPNVVAAWGQTREVAQAVEVREQVSVDELLISALLRQARGNSGTPISAQVTGALESCAGLVGHAFAAAEVHGPELGNLGAVARDYADDRAGVDSARR